MIDLLVKSADALKKPPWERYIASTEIFERESIAGLVTGGETFGPP
jgi:hypothetical protein